jgi:hypothetical protein
MLVIPLLEGKVLEAYDSHHLVENFLKKQTKKQYIFI